MYIALLEVFKFTFNIFGPLINLLMVKSLFIMSTNVNVCSVFVLKAYSSSVRLFATKLQCGVE